MSKLLECGGLTPLWISKAESEPNALRRSKWKAVSSHRTPKASHLVALLFFIAVLAFGSPAKTLDIYWIDSEGGGSTLIKTPAGESILIDSGNPGGRDSERIFKVASEQAGLKQIDFLIVTHFHMDHFGGAAELSERLPIRTVYDNGIPEQNPDNNPKDTRWPLLIKPYRSFNADARKVIQPGEVLPLRQTEGGAKLTLRCIPDAPALNCGAQAISGLRGVPSNAARAACCAALQIR